MSGLSNLSVDISKEGRESRIINFMGYFHDSRHSLRAHRLTLARCCPFYHSLPRDIVLDEGDIRFEPASFSAPTNIYIFVHDGMAWRPRPVVFTPPRSLLPMMRSVGRALVRTVNRS